MAQKIKNLNDLAKALEPKIKEVLKLVAEDVKKEIDDALQRYYDEYDPALGKSLSDLYYHRTNQLRDCCKIGKSKINGNKISIEVYLDVESLNYETEGADPYKTLRAGQAGLHGGWDVSNLASGQVSWSAVSGSDFEERWGSGTQIWSEPMHELFDNGKLVELFKKHAKKHGLNIK